MATKWIYESAVSSSGSAAAAACTTGTVTPNAGDLMIVSTGNSSSTTHNTALAISDTGSNTGWNLIRSILTGNGLVIGGAWWRLATATDSAGITVTTTASGGTGTNLSRNECDIFRVPGFRILGIDGSGGVNATTSSVSTLQVFPAGIAQTYDLDALAWAMLFTSASNGGVISVALSGGPTGNLTATGIGSPLLLSSSFLGGIQGNGGEIITYTWTTARADPVVIGANFTYKHTAGLLPVIQGF